jgi:RNA polymerase sigma-70 factor (ECF subfamily)
MWQTIPGPDDQFTADLIGLIPTLRAYARALIRDNAAAEDLAQEALARAWESHGSFTRGTNLQSWIFTILRNVFMSQMRRAWRSSPLDQAVAERTLVAPDDSADRTALNELRMALSVLPFEQREAILLVGAAGLAYEEAARVAGCPLGTMKSRVNRARGALRGALDAGGYERDAVPAHWSGDLILAEAHAATGRALSNLDGRAAA